MFLAGKFWLIIQKNINWMINMDPFVVTTKEKLRFEQQFNALGPVNGIVTGAQAKGFLLKSGLSPFLLGQIW